MGANSSQGWCLFLFLVGFTFLPAGLAYMGPIFALIGLACLVASLIGFYRLKPLEEGDARKNPSVVGLSAKSGSSGQKG